MARDAENAILIYGAPYRNTAIVTNRDTHERKKTMGGHSMAELNQGLVDLDALKKDIEDYPNKLRTALLRVLELEEKNTSLQKEIKSLEGNDLPSSTNRPPRAIYRSPYIEALHNDPELNRLKLEMGHLRTKTMAAIATNPSAYGLGTRP